MTVCVTSKLQMYLHVSVGSSWQQVKKGARLREGPVEGGPETGALSVLGSKKIEQP